MQKIALFNHKGGVGKTTLTVNLANAFADTGRKVLLVDADPQCNMTSFFIDESDLDQMLSRSDNAGLGETIWSAIKPVVDGRGGIKPIAGRKPYPGKEIYLLPGDVMLAEYEEVLPLAWSECFQGRTRSYDITTALSQVVNRAGRQFDADVCFYDVGPNVGALNRAVLLDCDYFITPVGSDLFSLRALTTVGRAMSKWIKDWQIIRGLASDTQRAVLPDGMPSYMGYISSAFKISTGRSSTDPHSTWERMIAPRVRDKVVRELGSIHSDLVPNGSLNKIGGIKNFHSLAPEAQKHGVAIGDLRGLTNSGNNPQVTEAKDQFLEIAREMIRRSNID